MVPALKQTSITFSFTFVLAKPIKTKAKNSKVDFLVVVPDALNWTLTL
jgi:hypothetical protein